MGSQAEQMESGVTFYGLMQVSDETGHLWKDWRTVKPGSESTGVEVMWFKITLRSGGSFPYVKQ